MDFIVERECKKENLSWNEAVKVMREGKIVKAIVGSLYRIKEGILQYEMQGEWCKSLNTPIDMGEMTYTITEEKKETLSDKIEVPKDDGRCESSEILYVCDVKEALKVFLKRFSNEVTEIPPPYELVKEIFGENLV